MAAALKAAGVARTSAISLAGLEFAETLSTAIKTHVDAVEALFNQMQTLFKGGPSEKDMKKFMKKIAEHEEKTQKLQAGLVELGGSEFLAT